MNSRVSWSNEGIDPSVRERAEAAARRAGMSLNDWINSTLGDSTPPNYRSSHDQWPAASAQESRDIADIHQRLDAIAQQIEQISQGRPRNDGSRAEVHRSEPPVARQLNDAIARLDARLAQITNPASGRHQTQERERQAEMVERAASQVYRPSPPLSPASLDFAVAEIAARQNELDNAPLARQVPPLPPPAPTGPDFSSLERHLLKITSQIEALHRPDHIDQSIAAFRRELSDIRLAITEAMPRRAIESIENEIRSLARRIDDSRQSGIDSQALAGIEGALGEIREVLRSLTPAEQLAGYDEAIRNLTAKLEQILRANDDPSTIHQLESAIAALRAIVANIASNDALARLSEDVHVLSFKVDQLARVDHHADSFAALEQRLAALTSSLENREQRPAVQENSEHIESALRALSDRLDRMPVGDSNFENIENALRGLADRLDRIPVGNDDASAFAHLEQRVTYLLERLEVTADRPSGNLVRVEEGLQDILHQLERQHASITAFAATGRNEQAPSEAGFADLVKHQLSDIRFSQAETDRHTQDSLEAVHNTLGHVVDRLATIEGDLRTARVQMPAIQAEAPSTTENVPPPPGASDAAPSSAFEAQAPALIRHRSQWCRNPNPNCPIPQRCRSISTPPRANSIRHRPRRRPRRSYLGSSAKFWSRMQRERASRSSQRCRPIIRSSRERGPRGARLRRRSASRLPRAPSAKFRRLRASPSARQVSSPRPGARPKPPPQRRRPKRPAAAARKHPSVRTRVPPRRSPPGSARCSLARAWS